MTRRPRVRIRIRDARRLKFIDQLWDVNRFNIVECVRHLRNWLADPPIPDEMRRGDAELLARLQAHLKDRPPPRVHVLTWEELEIRNAMRAADGKTRH